jgi:hypothetical protein
VEVKLPIAHNPGKDAHTTEGILRARVKEEDPFSKIQEAAGYVGWLRNGLIGYHIMSHLTPGAGTDAIAIWDGDPGIKYVGDMRVGEDVPIKWLTRPGWIALVHELILAGGS